MDFNTSLDVVKVESVSNNEAKRIIRSFLEEHEDLEDLTYVQLESLLHAI